MDGARVAVDWRMQPEPGERWLLPRGLRRYAARAGVGSPLCRERVSRMPAQLSGRKCGVVSWPCLRCGDRCEAARGGDSLLSASLQSRRGERMYELRGEHLGGNAYRRGARVRAADLREVLRGEGAVCLRHGGTLDAGVGESGIARRRAQVSRVRL